jgi:hypothetical protein
MPPVTLAAIQVEPARIVLQGKWAAHAMLVTCRLSDGSTRDFTAAAEYASGNPAIAEVRADGIVRPVSDGEVPITVVAKLGGSTASAQVLVTVKEAASEAATFLRDVMPLLSRSGCNAAQCHGAAMGKGGLKLSMFGGEPEADYEAITKMHWGRRINKVEPLKSLLLLKASNAVAHTGGVKIDPASAEHAMLAAWIAQDVPWGDDKLHKPTGIAIFPSEATLAKGDSRQLLVRAVHADGSERDVTRWAAFASSDPAVVTVDAGGRIKVEGFGEATVSAVFMRQSAVIRVLSPQPLPVPFAKPAPNNRIDELVFAKLQKLGLPPSEVCTDEAFLRRAFLDVIGVLPKSEEVRAFLGDPDPAKRTKVIEQLLARDEYADFWALKWSDLLRIKSEYPVRLWPRGVQTYYRWVHSSVAANKPYSQFARELLTANGSDFQVGPANYYRAVQKRDPQTYAEATSVLFLGARLECARCHGHPTESWGLDDCLGMAAFFSKVAIKATQEWKEEVVFSNQYGGVYHPKLRDYVNPKSLGAEALNLPRDQDPRPQFAEWLTSPQNPWFAKVMANRVWYWLMGRGIVHEPDDFRSTNPPSNPELLDYLAQEFADHNYDVKYLFRLILNSKTYQLSSKPNDFNSLDKKHFSHYVVRRLGAEQLLDAVCQITGVSDQFASWIPVPPTIMPAGSRAAQVFDGDIKNPLLDVFGRPLRDTPYECERKLSGSVRQSLHLVNSDHFEGKVANSPNLQRLLQANKPDPETIDEVYLATLARPPRPEERQKIVDYLSGAGKIVAPQFETDKKAADDAVAKVQSELQQAQAALEAAQKAAQDVEAVAVAAMATVTETTSAQTAAETAAAGKRQQATDAKKMVDDLAQNQLPAAEAKLAQLVQAVTEATSVKAAADQALAAANNALASLQPAADVSEKTAQEAAARSQAISQDSSKSEEEKKQAVAEAAAHRTAADVVKNALSQSQQQQQQAQSAVSAAAEKVAQAEAPKKAAEDVITGLKQQTAAATQAYEGAETAAKDAETAAANAKVAADNARAAHAAAAATVTEKQKVTADAQAVRDKLANDEKAAVAQAADAAKKLADAVAALKPNRDQAFQDLVWALMNTKEFLFNH